MRSPLQAPGQGEGRDRRPHRRALDPRSPPQSDVLLPRRGEPGDPRARRLAEQPAIQEAPRVAGEPVRGARSACLRPLPATPFEYATWKGAKVSIDYHVEYERHY